MKESRQIQTSVIAARLVTAVKKWQMFLHGELPPAEQAYCREWFKHRTASMGLVNFGAAWVFHGCSLLLDPYITNADYAIETMRIGHVLTLTWCTAAFALFGLRAFQHLLVAVPSHLISLLTYCYLLYQTVERSALVDGLDFSVVRAWTTLLALSIFQILIVPGYNWRVPFFIAGTVFIAVAICWASSPFAPLMMPIAAWILLMAPTLHMLQTIRQVGEARGDFMDREERSRAERALVDRELELARDVQDSLITPDQLWFRGLTVSFYQRKHGHLSGDWAAVRVVNDDLIVMVADAAGKGIQAALVVHAVQALWAGALIDQSFDPEAWLTRVNKALALLGEKNFHMVTMGLLRINQEGLATYWSAGHIPVFIVEPAGVRRLHGTGTPLGLSGELVVEVVETQLGNGAYSVLLGSDGTFHRGALQRHKDVVAIRDLIRTRGVCGLDALPAVDDKTLIWIEQTERVGLKKKA